MNKQDESDIMLLIEYANKWYCLPELIDDFGYWRSQGFDTDKAVYQAIKDWERNNATSTG